MGAGNGCCKTKLTVVKITDNQQLSSADIKIIPPVVAFSPLYQNAELIKKYSLSTTTATNNSPPPVSGSLLCVLHSIFLI